MNNSIYTMVGYITWAFIAMIGYSFVFLFAKLAMNGGHLTPYTVMTIITANSRCIGFFPSTSLR